MWTVGFGREPIDRSQTTHACEMLHDGGLIQFLVIQHRASQIVVSESQLWVSHMHPGAPIAGWASLWAHAGIESALRYAIIPFTQAIRCHKVIPIIVRKGASPLRRQSPGLAALMWPNYSTGRANTQLILTNLLPSRMIEHDHRRAG